MESLEAEEQVCGQVKSMAAFTCSDRKFFNVLNSKSLVKSKER